MNDEYLNSWLEIDEATDVVASLRHTLHLFKFVSADSTIWKWVILSMHSATQGAMVCHLNGTDNLGCLSEISGAAKLDWREHNRRFEINRINLGSDEYGLPSKRPATKADFQPREYLAKPSELFERLMKPTKRLESGVGQILQISVAQRRAFKKLDELRNQFIHFSPMGWSIEIAGLPTICSEMLSVISMIESDDWPFRHLKPQSRAELKNLILELQGVLQQMR